MPWRLFDDNRLKLSHPLRRILRAVIFQLGGHFCCTFMREHCLFFSTQPPARFSGKSSAMLGENPHCATALIDHLEVAQTFLSGIVPLSGLVDDLGKASRPYKPSFDP